jgi:hypothetical protein
MDSVRKATRLTGKEFEPPRRPDILTRSLVVAFNDWRHGVQKGRAEAAGHKMADREGVPHVERMIDAQAARAVEDQRHGFRYPIENAEKVRQDAIEEQADAGREVAKLDERDAELAIKEAELGRRSGPGWLAYSAILVALFCLTWPIDYGVAMWTPLPPLGQWMLTVFIGVVMVLCAHQAAKRSEDLEESHGQRDENPFVYRKDQGALAAALIVPLAVIGGTTIWRGQVFASDAQATGGPVGGGVVTIALGLLALLAFVVAVLAGMSYRRMQPLREVRAQRGELDRQRRSWQAVVDRAERTQRQAAVTLAFLDEREEHVIRAIAHWAQERKARLAQRAAWVSMREQQKRANAGSRPSVIPRSVDVAGSSESADRLGEQLRLLPLSVNDDSRANGAG